LYGQARAKVFTHKHKSYTPTGKGRVLRQARLLSGTGMGSGEGSGKQLTVASQVVGAVVAVVGMTAYAVHHYDQDEIKRLEDKAATEIKAAAMEIKRVEDKAATEIKRVEDMAATEIKLAAMEIARVEGDRKLAEDNLKAEVARYKQDVVLAYSEDYKPYWEAIRKKKSGGTWWSWLFG